MITFYKIYCKDENITECYIGSTSNYKSRIRGHGVNCNNKNGKSYNSKVYCFIRENGGVDNWEFKILNEVEFFDKELRLRQEQIYIDFYKPELNSWNAYTSEE